MPVHSLTTVTLQSIDTFSHQEFSALQSHAPVIAEFGCKCPKTLDGKLQLLPYTVINDNDHYQGFFSKGENMM